MKFVRILSIPLLAIGFTGSVAAFENGSFSLGEGLVGEAAWKFVNPPKNASTIKPRAQVVAELREAQRLGLVNNGGEGDIAVATVQQERLITAAGLRALGDNSTLARR